MIDKGHLSILHICTVQSLQRRGERKRNAAYLQCSLEGVEEEETGEKKEQKYKRRRDSWLGVYNQPGKRAEWVPDCIKIASR